MKRILSIFPILLAVSCLFSGPHALAAPGRADAQANGKCSWFTEAEARKLLGKGELNITQSGTSSCVAHIAGSRVHLSVDAMPNERDPAMGYRKPGEGLCPGVLLPQFGDEGVAEFKCPAPMNRSLRIAFRKNGVDVEFNYAAPEHDPGDAEVALMLPMVKRAYDAF